MTDTIKLSVNAYQDMCAEITALKTENRNLMVCSHNEHTAAVAMNSLLIAAQERIVVLEAEVARLESLVKLQPAPVERDAHRKPIFKTIHA